MIDERKTPMAIALTAKIGTQSQTISVAWLLEGEPEYVGITAQSPSGDSTYHSICLFAEQMDQLFDWWQQQKRTKK